MKPTQEQVSAWAEEADFVEGSIYYDLDVFLRFAAIAYEAGRKDENEACARVCDERANLDGFEGSYADKCAAAIRARREK